VFYKLLGYAVWKLASAQLRSRYGHLVKPGGAAVATAIALVGVWVATRGGDE
jgi:hypothetical protein